MLTYAARRVLMAVPIIFGVATMTFFLLKLAPGDPALAVLGEKADTATVDRLRESLGLNRSIVVQYFSFLGDLLQGHLGNSFIYSTPVTGLIGSRLPVTLLLMVVSIVQAALISVPLALWMSASKTRLASGFVRVFAATFQGMPTFFVGSLLITGLGLKTGLFPVGGYGETFLEHLYSLVLPGLAVALSISPILVRSLVASLNDSLDAPYVDFARAKGLPARQVMTGYALRNSSISAVSILGIQVGHLVGGALVIENVFGLPGLGTLLLHSVISRDFPVVQALTILLGALVVLVYVLTDIGYSLLDPRVRLAGDLNERPQRTESDDSGAT